LGEEVDQVEALCEMQVLGKASAQLLRNIDLCSQILEEYECKH
jgi:hypothetical protein